MKRICSISLLVIISIISYSYIPSEIYKKKENYFCICPEVVTSYALYDLKTEYIFDKEIKWGIHGGIGIGPSYLSPDKYFILSYSFGLQYYL